MKEEHFARVFIVLLISGMVIAIFATRAIGAQSRIEVHGRMAESGGWTPDTIHAQVGVPIHLRLTSDDVVHGFAIGQSDKASVDIKPGEVTDLTLEFDKPGEYKYYCTRWCGVNHWRMRGTILVSGPSMEETTDKTQPLYLHLNIDIDAPHLAIDVPNQHPVVVGSMDLPGLDPLYLSLEYYRSHSPSEVYRDLRAAPSLSTEPADEIWDLVGSIWRANTSIQGLSEGKKLYQENCAACHGEAGEGNGVFAGEVDDQFNSSTMVMGHTTGIPANFTDPKSMLGASPALLQGKIVRGGMGTGMPYWGPIFTEEQIWNLVAYLYSFQFDYQEITP